MMDHVLGSWLATERYGFLLPQHCRVGVLDLEFYVVFGVLPEQIFSAVMTLPLVSYFGGSKNFTSVMETR